MSKSNAHINRIRLAAVEYFKKFEGVIGVGYGLKEKEGKVTHHKALRIYVAKKRSTELLDESEVLPTIYQGLQTDVCEARVAHSIAGCSDNVLHEVVTGGINILAVSSTKTAEWNTLIRSGVNRPDNPDDPAAKPVVDAINDLYAQMLTEKTGGGTGGAVFRIKNDERDNYILLTCHHVLSRCKNNDKVYSTERDENRYPKAVNSKIKEYERNRIDLFTTNDSSTKEILRNLISTYEFSQFVSLKYYGKVFMKDEQKTISHPIALKEHGNVELNYFVDSAYVLLDTQWSKSCRKYKGIKHNEKIQLLNVNEKDTISRLRTVSCKDIGKVVFKAGGRSGRTRGEIVDIFGAFNQALVFQTALVSLPMLIQLLDALRGTNAAESLNEAEAFALLYANLHITEFQHPISEHFKIPGQLKSRLSCSLTRHFKYNPSITRDDLAGSVNVFFETEKVFIGEENIIVIKALEVNCEGNRRFADEGDSGSLVVNEQNEVIGQVFAINTTFNETYACHIIPIFDYLNLNQNISSRSRLTQTVNGTPTRLQKNEDIDLFNELKKETTKTPIPSRFRKVLEEHYDEVVNLVHHKRPVMVTWHRQHGPAYLAHFEKSYHNPQYNVPSDVKGIPFITLLQRMKEALYTYGSPSLKQTLDEYSTLIIETVKEINSLSLPSILNQFSVQTNE